MGEPKILILHNLCAGPAQTNLDDYLKALRTRGAMPVVRLLDESFNLPPLLEDASNFERVVVVGGDGTVSAVAALLQGTRIPVLAYPAGTANLLALNLKIPETADALAEITLKGALLPIDLGKLECRLFRRQDYLPIRFRSKEPPAFSTTHFVIMAGSGFFARLISDAQPLKERFGKAAYWLSAFWNRYPPVVRIKLNIDGRVVRTWGIGVLIVNFGKIQFDLKVAPDSNAQDGKFEIVILKAKSLWALFPGVWSLVVERLGFKRPTIETMEILRGSQIEITTWPPWRLQFDGENLSKTSFFKVTALPRVAHFVSGAT